ncbi:MAG TPA: hypothetical protein VF178_04950, partial [Gemmatimonadaceae bacterium]
MTITLDTLDFGSQLAAGVVVKDQQGAPMDINQIAGQITLESSDSTVAAVDGTSLTLVATGLGNAVITARYGNLEAHGTLPVRLGPAPAQRLVAGDGHNCVITASGTTECWGLGENGTLGDGLTSTASTGSPVIVAGEHTFTTLTAGNMTCGLEDGAAWCWGSGSDGALGNGADTNAVAPVAVHGGLTFAQISAGWGHVCALTTDGSAYCWGYNADGEVGSGTVSSIETEPVPVDVDVKFAQIQASGDHTCALTRLGKLYCWGYGLYGVLGTVNGGDQHSPVAALDTLTFVSLSGGYYHECGLDRTGRAICWGRNNFGETGTGTVSDSLLSPVAIQSTARFAMLGAGTEEHLCGVELETSQLYCWGQNRQGQIGNGDTNDALSPAAVPGFLASAVTTGLMHSCAIDTSGDVYCWGNNQVGQIGNGSIDSTGTN